MEVRVVVLDGWRGDDAIDACDDAFEKFTAAGDDKFRDFLFDIMIAPYGAEISTFEDFGDWNDVSNVYWLHVRDVLLLDRQGSLLFSFQTFGVFAIVLFVHRLFVVALLVTTITTASFLCEFFHIVFDFISDILIRTNVVAWFLWSYGCASRKAQRVRRVEGI